MTDITCPECGEVRQVSYKTKKEIRCRPCYILEKTGVRPSCVKPKKPRKKYDRTNWDSYKKQKEKEKELYIKKEKERNRTHKLEATKQSKNKAIPKLDPEVEEAKIEAMKQKWLKKNKIKVIPDKDFSKEYSGQKIHIQGY